MNGAWLKLFYDGTKETGTDIQIQNKEASWSCGRLTDIETVHLSHSNLVGVLSVPHTSWHQFDRFALDTSTMRQYRLYRAVQAEIQSHHIGQYLVSQISGRFMFWAFLSNLPENYNSDIMLIDPEMVGKWITLVVPATKLPYITLSNRGTV